MPSTSGTTILTLVRKQHRMSSALYHDPSSGIQDLAHFIFPLARMPPR